MLSGDDLDGAARLAQDCAGHGSEVMRQACVALSGQYKAVGISRGVDQRESGLRMQYLDPHRNL